VHDGNKQELLAIKSSIAARVCNLVSLMRDLSILALKYQEQIEPCSVMQKQDLSPVTNADIEISTIIHNWLEGNFASLSPSPSFVCEERIGKSNFNISNLVFLTDPIDGTREFIKKTKFFTINIGICYKGKPIAGFVAAPAFDEFYYGICGDGAFVLQNFLHTNPASHVFKQIFAKTSPDNLKLADDCVVKILTSSNSKDIAFAKDFAFKNNIKNFELTTINSSLKGCLVARGDYDFYLRNSPTNQWDIAAIHAIVVAAGGRFKNLSTEPFLGYCMQGGDNSIATNISSAFKSPVSFYLGG
jgi:3'(2'), 5'-bisphosphate nucleotidase